MNLLNRKFQRKLENFICGKCGARVKGNGYTNHCPECLWSRHVDDNPGDRASGCNGYMEPISSEITGDGYTIIHKCTTCGRVRRNKAAENDSRELIINISAKR